MSRKIRRFGPPRQAGFKANGDCDLPGAIDQGLGALDRTAHRRSIAQELVVHGLIGADFLGLKAAFSDLETAEQK